MPSTQAQEAIFCTLPHCSIYMWETMELPRTFLHEGSCKPSPFVPGYCALGMSLQLKGPHTISW